MNRFSSIVKKIREIYNEPEGFIPLHAPIFLGNEKKYLGECIDSTFVSSVGKFVNIFEEEIANYTKSKSAVVCVNGTNALHLALKLAGVEEGDEVITQALTFISTANAISYCNAKPVFIDVDNDTLGMSPNALAQFLEKNVEIRSTGCYNIISQRRIKCCVPMHTFGHPCRIDEIIEVCNRYNIEVVEDAAESLGSYYKGKHTGTFGSIGVLSFNGNKIITTGGGGMLLFKDKTLAEKAKHLTTQAKILHAWEFIHDDIGYNYRMPNLNAALGLAQFEIIDKLLFSKRSVAEIYYSFFKTEGINFIQEPENAKSNYWLNAILLNSKDDRDQFLKITNEAGVMTRPVWRLMNELQMFSDCITDDLNNSKYIQDRLVNIPSSAIINE
ncbi:MAG: LegC family aminotransferase [Marinilabiliaceae bacterium]|nr:LegC family aminotransferase [Marinilabiliaceae bacterium]